MKDETTPTVNFQNLIYPVHVGLPVRQPTLKQHSELSLALFNAQSVGSPKTRTEITTFLRDCDIDVLFLTETWLGARGDQAMCCDLTPPGYSMQSYPRSSRGGGVAVIFKNNFSPYVSFTTTFPFCHTSFELAKMSFTLPQKTIHFFCVYRPSPSPKNRLTDYVSNPVS